VDEAHDGGGLTAGLTLINLEDFRINTQVEMGHAWSFLELVRRTPLQPYRALELEDLFESAWSRS
jgi:hypothetical protein